MKKIVLDTHVWIWFATGETTLSTTIRKIITDAANNQNAFIADISLWEIAMLEKKNRLTFSMPCQEWIEQSLTRSHLEVLPITPAIATDSSRLPGKFHGDPADQLIVATARIENLQLITRDEKILTYSKSQHVLALKA